MTGFGNDATASDTTPAGIAGAGGDASTAIADTIARAVTAAATPLRVRLLQGLLAPIGPLAMAVLAHGAFAKYVASARRWPLPISADDAERVTSVQLCDLVGYVEQADPGALVQVVGLLAQDPAAAAAAGASLAALAVALATRPRDRQATGPAKGP